MKLWDKGYDIDGFTESFTIGKDRELDVMLAGVDVIGSCLLYTSPSPRDVEESRMPSSA